MNQLLARLLEERGDKWLPRDACDDGKRHYMRAIADTNEFRRIRDLPRRTWGNEFVDFLTEALSKPGNMQKLWPEQAQALAEVVLYGLLGPIGVGHGKTLISLLIPTVLDAERSVLLVPAKLKQKTLEQDLPELSQYWQIKNNIRVISYSALGLEKNANLLFDILPDVIICDEAHFLRNPKAGRTRRVARYLKAHPNTAFVALSGTLANRSFTDWAHLSDWALHNGSPLPRNWNELTEWSLCFDVNVPDEQRPLPGALRAFCEGEETIRDGWRRRFVSTPGVVATGESEIGSSLIVQKIANLSRKHELLYHLEKLRDTWTTPNGDEIVNNTDLWRHARELALGFYYRWDPPAPKEWLAARSAWKRYVREVLKHNKRGLDTELQVWNESKRNPHREWSEWNDVKTTFEPNSVPDWISNNVLLECGDWLDREDSGIVWVEHVAFGKALAELTNHHYFGAGDNGISTTSEKKIIASIAAHGEGKNLQRWSRNLVTSPPANGKAWEQLLGRTHREGQLADEVIYDVFLHEPELVASFDKALEDAQYIEETYGTRQRLRYAVILLSDNNKNETE